MSCRLTPDSRVHSLSRRRYATGPFGMLSLPAIALRAACLLSYVAWFDAELSREKMAPANWAPKSSMACRY